MIDDPVLVNDWHPVASTDQLDAGAPIAACASIAERVCPWEGSSAGHLSSARITAGLTEPMDAAS